MGFEFIPGIGTVHFFEVKKTKIVPGPERHKWDCKPTWGQEAKCIKCGCVKRLLKPEYIETYQMPGEEQDTLIRPACKPKNKAEHDQNITTE
nr:hypothetical protein [uncultured Arsenicibacter sp.]